MRRFELDETKYSRIIKIFDKRIDDLQVEATNLIMVFNEADKYQYIRNRVADILSQIANIAELKDYISGAEYISDDGV